MKMKKKKRILSLITAAVLCAAVFPVTAFAQTPAGMDETNDSGVVVVEETSPSPATDNDSNPVEETPEDEAEGSDDTADETSPFASYDGSSTLVEEIPQDETNDSNVVDEDSSSLSPDGNLTLVDDIQQDESDGKVHDKQFITLQSKAGNTFYLVIDRSGDTDNVYFMNLVDEADLLALTGKDDTKEATCTCTQKCAVGAINEECEVCRTNMNNCTGTVTEPEQEETVEPEEPTEKKTGNNMMPIIVFLVVAGIGGGAFLLKFKKGKKTDTKGGTVLDDYDYGQDDDDEYEKTEIDDADLMDEMKKDEED